MLAQPMQVVTAPLLWFGLPFSGHLDFNHPLSRSTHARARRPDGSGHVHNVYIYRDRDKDRGSDWEWGWSFTLIKGLSFLFSLLPFSFVPFFSFPYFFSFLFSAFRSLFSSFFFGAILIGLAMQQQLMSC